MLRRFDTGRTFIGLCALAVTVAVLSLAPPAFAGQIVFTRGDDLWTMNDDGTGQELLIATTDTPEFFVFDLATTPFHVESLDEPSVDEGTGTLLFTGYFDANPDDFSSSGVRADGLYKYEGGEITRLSLDPAHFDDFFHFESEPESMGDGRLIFSNTACETESIICSVELNTQQLDDLPDDGTVARTNWGTKCDDELYVSSPAPNPVNANQIAYTGCETWTAGTGWAYEMLVSGPNRAGERVISSDDYTQEDPAWRADGQKVVAIEEGTNPGIYEFNPNATNDKRRIVVAPRNYIFDSPRYTGDGRIVFEGSTDTNDDGWTDATNVYSVPATCTDCAFPGGVTQLTTDGDSGSPAWTSHDTFAAAGEAAVADGALQLNARDGEANDIDVAPAAGIAAADVHATAAGTVRISDARGLTPGADCTPVSATVVECSGVQSVRIDAGDGNDTVQVTGRLRAVLDGGEGSDTLRGGDAGDTLDGGPGADTLDGGRGIDTITYGRRTQPVAIRLDGNRNDGADGDGNGTSSAAEEGDQDISIENAVGGSGADQLVGSSRSNVLRAGGGGDVLNGAGRGDVLDGGDGVDTLSYESRDEAVAVRLDGAANDGSDPDRDGISEAGEEADRDISIEDAIGGSGDDTLVGSREDNVLVGRRGSDVLDGGLGADTLNGHAGIDLLSYEGRGDAVAVRLDGRRNDGADTDGDGRSSAAEEGDLDLGIENAATGRGGDTLVGGSAVNVLRGGAGDDTLDGGAAADTLDGGRGYDLLDYSRRGAAVAVRLDDERNDGADTDGDRVSEPGEEADLDVSIERARGGSGDDFLRALSPVVNRLFGGAGNDLIVMLDGTAAVDEAYCGPGTDRYSLDPSDVRPACERAL